MRARAFSYQAHLPQGAMLVADHQDRATTEAAQVAGELVEAFNTVAQLQQVAAAQELVIAAA